MAIKGDAVGLYLAAKEVIIPDCNIFITQPTVEEVLKIGETNFLQAIQYLSRTGESFAVVKNENAEIGILSDLQLLLLIYHHEPVVRADIDKFFELVFPRYIVKVTENSIDFLDPEDDNKVKGRINPFNFESLQTICLDLFLPFSQQEKQYNPQSAKAKEIADKLKKGREEKARREGGLDEPQSLYGTELSILSIGLQMSISDLARNTLFQLNDMFMRFTAKLEWDQYFKISTIPFTDSSKLEAPDYWTSNIYSR